jgi:Secretion system C-terminal sorting domain
MKKTLILLALIITTFAIAKNKDDSHKKSLVGPTAPVNFRIKPLVNQYWNANTFIWDAGPAGGTPYHHFTIYLKRTTESSFRKINVSIISTEYTLTDAQMPMPMNYVLYVTATDAGGNESPAPSQTSSVGYTYYEPNQTISPPVISLPTINGSNGNFVLLFNGGTGSTNPQGFNLDYTLSSSPNIVGYFIYANDTPVGFSSTASYFVKGLQPNTNYNITVAAIDMYGNTSARSNILNVTTADYDIPKIIENAPSYDADNYIKQLQIGYNNYKYPAVQRNSPAQVYPKNYFDFSVNSDVGFPKLIIGKQGIANNNNKVVVRVANKSLRDASVIVGVDFDYNGVFDASEITLIGGMNFQNNNLPNIANISSNGAINDIPLDFCSTIIIPDYAYAGIVKMRIIYSRYKFTQWNVQYILSLIKNTQLVDFIGNLTQPITLPIGEIEDFDVELVRPTTTTARNAITSKNAVSDEKNSVSEKANVTDFVLYPNPVSGDVMNISLIEDNTPYRILNILGQEVGTGNVENGTISVAKLDQGNYLIELVHEDQRIVKRFIKQ